MNTSQAHISVNGQPIPPEAVAFELDRLVRFYARHMPEEQVRAQMDALRQKAIEQTIGLRLLMDEAESRKIVVSEQEVEERLAAMREEAGGAERFAALLQKQNLTEIALREQIRRGRRMDKLVETIVATAAEPTEEELRAHFEAHSAEYSRAERVQAQHILVAPAADDEAARDAARSKLTAIRQRVRDGAKFADEAAAHSACPSGRQAGGSLGWFSRGMMVEAFDRAVFAMPVGALSEIVETPFGFHIIQKTAHEPAAPANYEEARENIRDFLRHAARGAALSAHVADLRAKAKIEIKA
jgi:peptidyl-prolyl cis-trans isomerase C